ncbi:glycosyltransferase family 2 protein [Zavarzinia sp. CC-PAN008]|uniref:glycosyltransferase family 2 protein n=1 Tax=Zavarzinia sp. CC-PAN008 TaxID=3243332 RepID=UPI003F74313A
MPDLPVAPGGGAAWQRVTAVIVTHDSAAVIEPCLQSVAGIGRAIVVDNASTDDTRARVQAAGAELVASAVNLGYGNGANLGLERVTSDFALLLNPDAVLLPGCLEALVAAADRWPEAGMVAPSVRDAQGRLVLAHDVGLLARGRHRGTEGAVAADGDLCTWYLSGAVSLVRRTALERAGGFDPALFLYFEDDDMCLAQRSAGFSLVVTPQAEVMHLGGASAPATLARHWLKNWHYAWSELYATQKWQGRAAMHARARSGIARTVPKLVGHALSFRGRKLVRDAASLCGMLAYLAGRPASPTTRRARPEAPVATRAPA